MTQIVTLAGTTGKDAQFKTTQNGKELCSFSVAVNTGYGENKATTWWDVTRWGSGAGKLAEILVKGTKVTVVGEVSTREHDGKTYLQCRADHVTLQGGRQESRSPTHDDGGRRSQGGFDNQRQSSGGFGGGGAQNFQEDLDSDEVPFLAWGDTLQRRVI